VPEPDADTIHLSLPADGSMRAVVEVAIGVLARRWDLSDEEVATARAATGAAFGDLAMQGGDDPVEVDIHATTQRLMVSIAHVGDERTITAPQP